MAKRRRLRLWLLLGLSQCLPAFSQVSLSPDVSKAEMPAAASPSSEELSLIPIREAPGLPRVLLIGDSISMGYTVLARDRLRDVANVHRPPENCGPTDRGLARLDEWLGNSRWDVIHFNFGLHDLSYVNENRRAGDPQRDRQRVPVDEYRKNLRELVLRLKQPRPNSYLQQRRLCPLELSAAQLAMNDTIMKRPRR